MVPFYLFRTRFFSDTTDPYISLQFDINKRYVCKKKKESRKSCCWWWKSSFDSGSGSGVFANSNSDQRDSNPRHSDVDLQICRNMFDTLNHCATAAFIRTTTRFIFQKKCYKDNGKANISKRFL